MCDHTCNTKLNNEVTIFIYNQKVKSYDYFNITCSFKTLTQIELNDMNKINYTYIAINDFNEFSFLENTHFYEKRTNQILGAG